MNFTLTDERQMVQDTLRRFLSDAYTTETRNGILDSASGFSTEIWAQLAELGVLGALFPDHVGGFGGAGFDLAVVFEELGRAGVVEPVMEALIAGRILMASDRFDLLDQILAGSLHIACACMEPDGRYDFAAVQTRMDGNGRLTGRKAVVHNAEASGALIVSVVDAGQVVLRLVRADAPGLSMQGYALIAGGRAAEVTLDNTPSDPLSATLLDLEAAVEFGMVAQCAETLGAMETAVALTKDYLMTRQQFGRPIGTFQALQHRMADVLIELEQGRSAVINAAGHLSAKQPERGLSLSAAKNLLGRAGRMVAEEAIQLHGGIAMTREYELAHIAKRIVMADHRFGDTDYHLERFIALSA